MLMTIKTTIWTMLKTVVCDSLEQFARQCWRVFMRFALSYGRIISIAPFIILIEEHVIDEKEVEAGVEVTYEEITTIRWENAKHPNMWWFEYKYFYRYLGLLLHYWAYFPEFFLFGVLLYLFVRGTPTRIIRYVSFVGIFLCGWSFFLMLMLLTWYTPIQFLFGQYLLILNTYSVAVKMMFLFFFGAYLLVIEMSKVFEEDPVRYLLALKNYIFLVIFSCLLPHSHNLFVLFLLLEGISFAVTMLFSTSFSPNAYVRAGMQYFCLNFVSSGFLLISMVLIYLIMGSFEIDGIFTFLEEHPYIVSSPAGIITMLLFSTSFAIKLGVYPFSIWLAPLYVESSYDLILLYGVLLKALVFFSIFPYFTLAFGVLGPIWAALFLIWGSGSIFIGAVGAYLQLNIKEFLAHTSVNHFGHIAVLFGYCSVSSDSCAAVFTYLIVYTLASFGFIGILMCTYYDDTRINFDSHPRLVKASNGESPVIVIQKRGLRRIHTFNELCSLRKDQPLAAVAVTMFLLVFAGVPPTFGFFAKFAFYQQVFVWAPGLAAIFLLIQVCSLYSYFVPIALTWFDDSFCKSEFSLGISADRGLVISVTLVSLFLWGCGPFLSGMLLLFCLELSYFGDVSYYTPYISEKMPLVEIPPALDLYFTPEFWDSWYYFSVQINFSGTLEVIPYYCAYGYSIILFVTLTMVLSLEMWRARFRYDDCILSMPRYKILVNLSPKGEDRLRE